MTLHWTGQTFHACQSEPVIGPSDPVASDEPIDQSSGCRDRGASGPAAIRHSGVPDRGSNAGRLRRTNRLGRRTQRQPNAEDRRTRAVALVTSMDLPIVRLDCIVLVIGGNRVELSPESGHLQATYKDNPGRCGDGRQSVGKALAYTDALLLLKGAGMPAVGQALGGVLRAGGSALSAGSLSLLDVSSEFVRLGQVAVTGLRNRANRLDRLERHQRLRAAHTVIVVAALFEALEQLKLPFEPADVELGRHEQVRIATDADPDGATGSWVDHILAAEVPLPSPVCPYEQLLDELREWFGGRIRRLIKYLTALAVWDRLNETERTTTVNLLRDVLPARATERYEEWHRRLAIENPEFALWVQRQEEQATRVELRRLDTGMRALEVLLQTVTSGSRPGQRRRAVTRAYRADIQRLILGTERAPSGLRIPTLDEIYVDPLFRAKIGSPADRPSDEGWWKDQAVRSDLCVFLAGYLTGIEAVDAPLIVLGQPGAGKSALTRVLAARLPDADFLVVRVELGEAPAEANLQDQIEYALRTATGESISWPDLVRSAEGVLPVILLDGFDEILQATGVSQSDFLQRVAAFQHREATQQRPVAVIVTSRTAVADRARLPDGSLVVRLEPLSVQQINTWLEVWNRLNRSMFERRGLTPLPPEVLSQYYELVNQPLLLLMLALYDAQDNGVQKAVGRREPTSRPHGLRDMTELYERLLTSFAEREVRKRPDQVIESHIGSVVDDELTRLSIAALGMFNRSRHWITESELDNDLSALAQGPAATRAEDLRATLTDAQELVGRFFFVQRVHATRDNEKIRTYGFLHSTFGDFLMARFVVRLLHTVSARDAVGGGWPIVSQRTDDSLLFVFFGFAPMSSRGLTLSFVQSLLGEDTQRRTAVREWLIEAFRAAVVRSDVSLAAYQPATIAISHRLAVYHLNLFLLAVACGEPVAAHELYPTVDDPVASLSRTTQQWLASLTTEDWRILARSLVVQRTWTGGRRDTRLSLAAPSETLEPVDPFWIHGFGPGSEFRSYAAGRGFANFIDLDLTLQTVQLRGDLGEEIIRHAIEPFLARLSPTLNAFAVWQPGQAESIARAMIRLWVTSHLDEPALVEAYDRCVFAICSRAWGPTGVPHPPSWPALTVLLQTLARDAGRLPIERVIQWARTISDAEPFMLAVDRHLNLMIEAMVAAEAETPEDRNALANWIAALVRRGSAVNQEHGEQDHRLRLAVWTRLIELARPDLALELFGPYEDVLRLTRDDVHADRVLLIRLRSAALSLGIGS
jgi:NACHT conflict system protein